MFARTDPIAFTSKAIEDSYITFDKIRLLRNCVLCKHLVSPRVDLQLRSNLVHSCGQVEQLVVNCNIIPGCIIIMCLVIIVKARCSYFPF